MKTVREPYILEHKGGAELKSYAGGIQALVLIFVVFGYNALVKRLGRMQLAATIYLFFVANLVLFSFLGRADLPEMGVIFFVWVGCFSLTLHFAILGLRQRLLHAGRREAPLHHRRLRRIRRLSRRFVPRRSPLCAARAL